MNIIIFASRTVGAVIFFSYRLLFDFWTKCWF